MGAADSKCCCSDENNQANDIMLPVQPMNNVAGLPSRAEEELSPKVLGKQAESVPVLAAQGSPPASAVPPPPADSGDSDTKVYPDGSTYKGQLVAGMREGQGVYKTSEGVYEGEWKADKEHGRGKQTWNDGRDYEGEFVGGRFSGHGKMTWDSGNGCQVYEGQYLDDVKHGEGTFRWPDGRAYQGAWKNGKRHGKGIYVTSKGERKAGFWEDDRHIRWDKSEKPASP
eukprot:TRINITY_DN16831_c0_g1_i1.p1 TRINITY_DN16831_c0_g1~~TRINITY_DN16831_c0_g1_i1.p1  ORF type:complete len:227 (+),score=60.19 TRINITY_DN16831_c0_g1_i1:91-771(+)